MGDLSIQDLVVEYSSGADTVRPIDGFNLDVAAGSLVILMGPSGCGKTTLLSCLGGILRPTSGAIKFGDVDVTSLDGRELSNYRRETVGHRVPGVQPRAEPHRARERDGAAARGGPYRAVRPTRRPDSCWRGSASKSG